MSRAPKKSPAATTGKRAPRAASKNKSLESWIRDAADSIRGASRYIHASDADLSAVGLLCPPEASREGGAKVETYRPIAEIVETAMRDSAIMKSEGWLQSVPEEQDKLKVIEAGVRETDKALEKILKQLGI